MTRRSAATGTTAGTGAAIGPTVGLPAPHRVVVEYHDAGDVLPHLAGLDGIGHLRAVRDGALPPDPLMEALGIRVTAVDDGYVELVTVPRAMHLNLTGFVHGGFLSVLMDSATGLALHCALAAGETSPHIAASYQFLRTALPDVELRCQAQVVRKGRRVGHVRADVFDARHRHIAGAETTHAVVLVEERRQILAPAPG